MGLGLSQVWTILQKHDAHLTVRSKPGNGSTFSIFIPLTGEHQINEKKQDEPQIPLGNGETLLVVEDSNLEMAIYEKILSMLHYQIIKADNAENGLRLFLQHKDEIDLVISDFLLPDHDGIWFFEQIRKNSSSMPFIMITGYDQANMEFRSRLATEITVMKKPLHAGKLAKILENELRVSSLKL